MEPAKTGRPTLFSDEMCDTICTRLIEGESLRAICRDAEMPSISSVMKWLRENENFSQQYARAKEDQADTLADELIAIADETKDPAKARLQIDARKWAASKLKPKKYGDKVTQEHTGPDGGPIILWGKGSE